MPSDGFAACPAGPLETDPDIWLAFLSLLNHCWQNTQAISATELSALLSKLARGSPHSKIHSLVITWASDAALRFLSPTPVTTATPPTPTALAAAAEVDTKFRQSSSVSAVSTAAAMFCPDAFLEVVMRLCRAGQPSTRHSALQSLHRLTQASSAFMPHQLVAIASLACHSLTDSAELVSEVAIQLLVSLSAAAMHSVFTSAVQAAQQELPWRRLYALQPQQVAFQPEQLADLLDWLGQVRPLVASQPSKSGGAGVAGEEWLWTLLKACPTISGAISLPL